MNFVGLTIVRNATRMLGGTPNVVLCSVSLGAGLMLFTLFFLI